jgi:hypothetical protein
MSGLWRAVGRRIQVGVFVSKIPKVIVLQELHKDPRRCGLYGAEAGLVGFALARDVMGPGVEYGF